MKKICIVTIYNSVNSGSYWQAKALQDYLKENEYDVYFLEVNDIAASSHFLFQFQKFMKRVLTFKFKDAIRYIKICKEFKKLSKDFKTVTLDELYSKNFDYVVLGSDTIWNLDCLLFSKNYKKYFGGIFKNLKTLSYAASSANTTVEKMEKYSDIPDMLNSLYKISVRDNDTLNLISNFTNREISMVCDPTVLLNKDFYNKLQPNRIEQNKYIFLYLFATLSDNQIKELKEFAKENNLKIICGAHYLDFADECIINSPNLFLNYMLNADYVITDTFHGTIFSINLNKEFVSINRNKKKVNDFIKKCSLDERLLNKDSDLVKTLCTKVDYDSVNNYLNTYRENSEKFLLEALNNDEK